MESTLHRKDIDGLRALAVTLVICFHIGVPGFELGYLGVDIFFVISGFLVGGKIYEDIKHKNWDTVRFYTRRANRLFPALVVMLLGTAGAACLLLLPADLDYLRRSYVAATFFYSNLFFLRNTGYFDPAAEENLLLHTWSLSVEEQFYLFLPALILLIGRSAGARILNTIIILMALSLLSDFMLGLIKPAYNFFFTPSRLWEFLIGMLVAARHDLKIRPWLQVAIGTLVILIWVTAPDGSIKNIPNLLASISAAFFLIAPEGASIKSPFRLRPVCGVGLISYSLYLWHQPIVGLWRYANPNVTVLDYAFLTIAILVVSTASFYLIEQRYRRIQLPLHKLIPSMLLVVGVGFCALQLAFHIKPDVSGVNIEERNFHELVSEKFEDCRADFRCGKLVRGGRDGAILLVGDSHAEHFAPGLADVANDYDLYYLVTGDPFYLGLSNSGIITEIEQISLEYETLHIVFANHYLGNFSLLNFGDTYEDALQDAVRNLIKFDPNMALLQDIPRFRNHPRHCIDKYKRSGSERLCKQNTDAYIDDIEFHSNGLQRLANRFKLPHPIGFSKMFCNQSDCTMLMDGKLLYRDANHLSFYGSELVAPYLLEKLPMHRVSGGR